MTPDQLQTTANHLARDINAAINPEGRTERTEFYVLLIETVEGTDDAVIAKCSTLTPTFERSLLKQALRHLRSQEN